MLYYNMLGRKIQLQISSTRFIELKSGENELPEEIGKRFIGTILKVVEEAKNEAITEDEYVDMDTEEKVKNMDSPSLIDIDEELSLIENMTKDELCNHASDKFNITLKKSKTLKNMKIDYRMELEEMNQFDMV